jgi:DNA polymerase
MYTYGREDHKIYGAKFLENIIQFLARIVLFDAAVRLADLGYRFVLQVHDELVFVIHEKDVDTGKEVIKRELTRPPTWAPDLPLTADVNHGLSYGDAK